MEKVKQPITFSATIHPSSEAYNGSGAAIPNFTATGRPFIPSASKHGSGLTNLGTAESVGLGPPDLLPRRYTDDSTISIPVLPPNAVPRESVSAVTPTTMAWSTASTMTNNDDEGPIKHEPKTKLKFWRPSRKQSTSAHIDGDSATSSSSLSFRRKSKSNENFVMKSVTRGDYLKHYAKDEQGRYIGTEEPAVDCILRHAEDYLKWRRPSVRYQNEFHMASAESPFVVGAAAGA